MTNGADNNLGDSNGVGESTRETEHSGGHAPLPETLPKPTVWPAVLALGACFLAWGILTSWLFSAAGFVLFVTGCAGWVAELRMGKLD
jgi:hypothetical protein